MQWRGARALRELILKDDENKQRCCDPTKKVPADSNGVIKCTYDYLTGGRASIEVADKVSAGFFRSRPCDQIARCIGIRKRFIPSKSRCFSWLRYPNRHIETLYIRLGEKGAVTCLIDAMKNHPDDESVQLHVCTTLTNLAHNSLENRSRFVSCYMFIEMVLINLPTVLCMYGAFQRFIEADGVSNFLKVMTAFDDSAKFQRQASW